MEYTEQHVDALSEPASAVFVFEYVCKLLNQLHSKLLLTKITACLDDDRDTIPVG